MSLKQPTTTTWPTGAIPKIEPAPSHKTFLETVEPAYCLIDILSARRLVKRGETADTYTPDTTKVITTTTVDDEQLNLLRWESQHFTFSEIDIVTEFGPDYHIPTDYSVYKNTQTPSERRSQVKKHVRGVTWIRDTLSDRGHDDIAVIPLVKGITEPERNIVYDHLLDTNQPYAALYVQQFFSNGNRIRELETRIENIQSETQSRGINTDLLLIGLLSPNYLERLPGIVSAGAGLSTWRTRVSPRKQSSDDVRDAYDELRTSVEDALQ